MESSDTANSYRLISKQDGHTELHIVGDWGIGNYLPTVEEVIKAIHQQAKLKQLTINCQSLGLWDSRLISFIFLLSDHLERQQIKLDHTDLPAGVIKLLGLASKHPERTGVEKHHQQQTHLEILGNTLLRAWSESEKFLSFVGEVSLSLLRFVSAKARFRSQDFLLLLQECGPNALPIITLISLLIGLILAFMGAIQLRQFGADIYIANLVAIGMSREMGAMMTAIIMAGRTGAAFAAKLGSMQVNEEINAFKTMGITAIDFLVLPRILALVLMMPLLTLYANVIGMMGGLFVGVGIMDITLLEYYLQTQQSITLVDWFIGISKSMVYGFLIALIGCMSGIQCGHNSSAVGQATTTAVVRSIVFIIIADAIFTLLFESLGI